ncbi:MAG: arginyl aminopeptidase [Bacteroidetes bacterium MedPE-SWsnd-G1]|nr:MAG: arginyl aminopeptidase [Bacteroidetes bacterium MedPE-SWsnd-G1]
MKKSIALSALLLTGLSFVQAQEQDPVQVKYAETITVDDLKGHLTILASDALEGRETGERGQKMAAAYIKAHFQEIGLQAPVKTAGGMSHYQDVPLKTSSAGDIYLISDGNKLENGKDIYYSGSSYNSDETKTEVVFGGNGSKEALASIDVKGKSVLILNSDRRETRAAQTYVQDNGGTMLFAVNAESQEKFEEGIARYARFLNRGRIGLDTGDAAKSAGTFYVSPNVAAATFGKSFEKLQKAKSISKIKSGELTYKLDFKSKKVDSENVLGFLEGSDLKDEVLVITAHYDHEGVKDGKIYNGADDDGSGTTAVLDIAEAFALAKEAGNGPRRSILFMTVTAEEKGLLGSKYYSENPIFALENTVANLNIDMVGRRGYDHLDNDNYVYVIGADRLSTELHEVGEMANKTYMNMELDYTYNDPNDKNRFYFRSDHYNFAKHNIPIIFYFNGVHDDYHKHTDTVDKIEFELMAKRAKLVFHTAWEIANRDGRLIVDKGPKADEASSK